MSKKIPKIQKQNKFSSSLGFLVTGASAAVGLSNLWRFPTDALEGGGGIYLLCYLLTIGLVGLPIILAELALGRSKQQGLFESFSKHGAWKWIGALCPLICVAILCFYNVVAAWVLGYCWSLLNGSMGALKGSDASKFKEFFNVLRGDWQGNLVGALIMTLLAAYINRAGISGGIERCAKVLMPLFICVIFGIIVYACSLPNAWNGVSFYLFPNWENFRMETVPKALSQALMSLSAGMGVMVTYGAYVDKQENLYVSSAVITLSDTLVAFGSGLFIFAFLGHAGMDFNGGRGGEEGGTGLAFIVLPHSLLKNLSSPLMAQVILGAFFLLLAFAAITTSISLLEVATNYCVAAFNMKRKKTIGLLSLGTFFGSMVCIFSDAGYLGKATLFHEGLQAIVINLFVPLSLFLCSLFFAFRWKLANVFAEASGNKVPEKWLQCYMNVAIKYLCPLFAGVTGVFSIYNLVSA